MVNKVDAERYKNAGNTDFKNGKYEAAIAQYKLAVQADPTNPAYWYVCLSCCLWCCVVCCVVLEVAVFRSLDNDFVWKIY
jgi:tetratricopeptide (TPR) repeat protein